MEYRIEKDTLGEVKVPAHCLYGAQTERSLHNFPIGQEKMPIAVIQSLLLIKKSAAIVNSDLGLLGEKEASLIIWAVDELLKKEISREDFPLSVWQTGSGTQTNMNVNEVISNLICDREGMPRGSKKPVHPNDHVNMSQSSNDVIPTAVSIAVYREIYGDLLPALTYLQTHLEKKSKEFREVVKIGRTHLMDAVPMTLGQEFGCFAAQIQHAINAIEGTAPYIAELAIGGTAVGTGLNTHGQFAKKMAETLGKLTSHPFACATNTFEALATADASVSLAGSLRRTAIAFLKIASDIAMLSSGPNCGLAELILPANEPGSSIMPGKVNPTQCESLQQVACQVIGNMTSVELAATRSNFQLNLYRPMIAHNLLQSCRILSDSARNFTDRCLDAIEPNYERLKHYVETSLMLVTALNPHIGYEKSAKIAGYAAEKKISICQAGIELGFLTKEEFAQWVDPIQMAFPHKQKL